MQKKEGEDTEVVEGAEGGEGKPEDAAEEGEKEEKAEESDLINDAKAKVKDAMENINLPKMPKVQHNRVIGAPVCNRISRESNMFGCV